MDLRAQAPVIVLDRDAPRRDALAAALATAPGDALPRVLAAADADALAADASLAVADATLLVALADVDAGEVARLRAAVSGAAVLAVAPLGAAPGRDALALAQAAGCDGCLVYGTASELAATLRACGAVAP